jgi:hypothetical protein
MRIQIVQSPPSASIDGVRLDGFEIGEEYEVGNSVGALLLAEGWAVPVPLDAATPYVPFSEGDPYDDRLLYRKSRESSRKTSVPSPPRDRAHSFPPRKRSRR